MRQYILILLITMATLNSSSKFESRISGGKELENMDKREFMVGMGIKSGQLIQVECGGALIDSLHVVSAAHCAIDEDLYIFAKHHIIPEKQLSADDVANLTPEIVASKQKGTVVKVSRVFRHKKFIPGGGSNEYDIAVFKLEKPIEIPNYIKLPSIGTTDPLMQKNQVLESIGWGLTSAKLLKISDTLKSVNIKALTKEQCRKDSEGSGKTEDKICAGGLTLDEENKGACQGDSGGPLVYNSPDGPILIGAVSNGAGRCTEQISTQYTKVETYLDFIKQAVDETYNSPGKLRKGDIQSLPSGYSLMGTEIDIKSNTDIFSNDVKMVYAYDAKDKKWKSWAISNGVAPKDLHIKPRDGFWIYK